MQLTSGARDALDGAVTALTAAGVETPRLDAEVLLADVLGVERTALHAGDLSLDGPAARAYSEAVRRRAFAREPVAYITGRRHFRELELRVDRRALIPRPESELLVELGHRAPPGARVLDLCTGSGAVALALKAERPDLEVWASDVSGEALVLASENAASLALAVRFVRSDLFAALDDRFDAVLANPPYVADGEPLAPEIARHEPPLALRAGPDGLAVLRRLYREFAPLRRVRLACVEVGAGQGPEVAGLARAAGFPVVRGELDLAGVERVVVAER